MEKRRVDIRHELEALRKRAEGVYGTGRRSAVPPVGRAPGIGALAPESEGRVPRSLAEAVPGEETAFAGGAFWRIHSSADSIWPDAETLRSEYLESLAAPAGPAPAALGGLRALQGTAAGSVCYLDIETTGLGSAPLFLVGLMYLAGERLVVDQLFARDYAEEETVLGFLADFLPRFEMLVTFNGVSFDVPYIEERAAFHRLPFAPPARHVDLLLLARAALGGKTPNHKLQTLEAYLCGRKRVGDISGAEIPDAYHDFVRTGDASRMAAIIHHNRLDLVTMMQLVTIFISGRF